MIDKMDTEGVLGYQKIGLSHHHVHGVDMILKS